MLYPHVFPIAYMVPQVLKEGMYLIIRRTFNFVYILYIIYIIYICLETIHPITAMHKLHKRVAE